MLAYELVIAIGGILSAIAVIAIAIFAIISANTSKTLAASTQSQTSILQRQFDSEYRPWLGAHKIGFLDGANRKEKIFEYKNYGKLPARSVIERWQVSEKQIDPKNLDKEKMTIYEGSITFPNQERQFGFSFSDEQISKLNKKEFSSLFVHIIIEYNYANGIKGEYGIIAEFFLDGSVYIRKEWT